MDKVVCTYCGEESKYKPLIPKPKFFIFENMLQYLVCVKEEYELVCLECLDYETNELKDCY